LVKENRLKKGFYLLFVVRKEIKEKEPAEISAELMSLLNRSKVLV
jgi:RNase P protein component